MRKRIIFMTVVSAVCLGGLFLAYAASPPASPVPRTINYDGTLEKSGAPATGEHDFRFQLVDSTGAQVWPVSGYADRSVNVVNGRFAVKFPDGSEEALGDQVFETRPLHLRIYVKTAADSVYYQLTPNVPIDAVPFAVRSERAVQTDVLPPGAIMPFYGIDAPYGWLKADGKTIDYREDTACTGDICGAYLQPLVEHLRNINTTQSTPNPSDIEQAILPDLRGVFLRGQDLGADKNPDKGGDEIGREQEDGFKSHGHSISPSAARYYPNSDSAPTASAGIPRVQGSAISSTQNAGGSETRPKNVTVLHIVKW